MSLRMLIIGTLAFFPALAVGREPAAMTASGYGLGLALACGLAACYYFWFYTKAKVVMSQLQGKDPGRLARFLRWVAKSLAQDHDPALQRLYCVGYKLFDKVAACDRRKQFVVFVPFMTVPYLMWPIFAVLETWPNRLFARLTFAIGGGLSLEGYRLLFDHAASSTDPNGPKMWVVRGIAAAIVLVWAYRKASQRLSKRTWRLRLVPALARS